MLYLCFTQHYNRERTSLRARIRSLESGMTTFPNCAPIFCSNQNITLAQHTPNLIELESMKLMRAGMEEENHKMRRIISVYIQSSDLNDPAWDVMDEDDMGGECLCLLWYDNIYFLLERPLLQGCIYELMVDQR